VLGIWVALCVMWFAIDLKYPRRRG
jgi:hypothetical protein